MRSFAGKLLGLIPDEQRWADACLAHPFFSLTTYLEPPDDAVLRPSPEMTARLREAYLAAWTAFASRADLLRACDLARRVGPAHFAMSYYIYLVPVYQLDRTRPLVNQFAGGHGFTGLVYAFAPSGAELQFFCQTP